MEKKLTLEDGQTALQDHVYEKALLLLNRHGPIDSKEQLAKLLLDKDAVRFPVEIQFSQEGIELGAFGFVEKINEGNTSEGYKIIVDEKYQNNEEAFVSMVLYLLVCVNYGDFASFKEAELFGSILQNKSQDDYYEQLCQYVDQ